MLITLIFKMKEMTKQPKVKMIAIVIFLNITILF